MSNPEDYLELRKRWLERYLTVQSKTDTKFRSALIDAAEQAFSQVIALEKKTTFSSGVKAAQLRLVMQQVQSVHNELFKKFIPLIGDGQKQSASAAVTAFSETDRDYLRAAFNASQSSGASVNDFIEGQRKQAMLGVVHTLSRIYKSDQPLSVRVYRTKNLANNWVKNQVNSAILRNASAQEIATAVRKSIRPNTPGGVSYAAMRLGRTELNNAFHATTIALSQDRPWIIGMEWNLSTTHEVSRNLANPEVCEVYAAREWTVENVPKKPHPQCFSGEALVSAKSVRAVSKRRYNGSFIDVFTTEDSPHLSGTPNHPALTKRGWVSLSELREGDYLAIDTRWDDPSCFSIPNQDYVKTRIEDVFESFRLSLGVTSITVPGTAEQFHGDGIIGENIDIIRSDSFLQNSLDSEIFSEILFNIGDVILTNLISFGDLASMIDSLGFHSSKICRENSCLALVGSHNSGGFGVSSQSSSSFGEHVPDLSLRTTQNFGSILESQTGRIQFIRVIRVGERPGGFNGHVYNLETSSGEYSIDSAVVHNCRCFATPKTEPMSSFVAHLTAGTYRDWMEQNAA